jgi:DGQHR domain-containing protein
LSFTYDGFITKQREHSDIEYITFIASAKEVFEWSHADSITLDKNGVQRDLNKTRWRKIKKFFESNENNIIPNSIIIACDESIQEEFHIENKCKEIPTLHKISFSDKVKNNTFIIDGQHRLKGISEVKDEDIKIVVTLFLGLNKLERAFQFITINNKSHKVPTDNIKALINNFDTVSEEESLKERLSTASITAGKFATVIDIFNENSESPFYKLIDWPNNRTGEKIIKPLAIESALKNILKYFPELKDESDDVVTDILFKIWNPIKNHYKIRDNDTVKKFKNLFTKTVIIAITEFIVDKMADKFIFSTEDEEIDKAELAESLTTSFITGIPDEFWKTDWSYKSLDSQGGRKIIIDDLSKIKVNIRSGRNWDENIKLTSAIE